MKFTMSAISLATLVMCAGLTVGSSTAFAQEASAPAVKSPEKKAERLTVGSDAPALKVGKFIKGAEVKGFEKGKTYVVEFWATWCGPCKRSIPHLTELAKKHKDKLTVIGVSVWEDDESYVETVTKFVEKMGEKMEYVVAVDDRPDAKGSMATTWMKASGQDGIPASFIVDGTGKIAWIGHPMEMDKPLEQILAGTYDTAAAKKEAEEAQKNEQAAAAKLEQMQKDFAPIRALMQSQDNAGAVKAIDELLKTKPEYTQQLSTSKFRILIDMNSADANGVAQKLASEFFKDNAIGLNELAWTMLDTKSFTKGDINIIYDIAKRAAEVTKMEDGMVLDTFALATFKKGDIDKAIELQSKAVELTKGQGEDVTADIQARLEEFKKAKK